MSIKNILAAYSGGATRGAGLRHAIKLAHQHDAYLTGVLRHGRPLLERRFAAHIPDHLFEGLREADALRIAEVRDRFLRITSEAGLADRVEFVDLDPKKDQSLAEFARSFDLVVTGTHTGDESEAHLSAKPDVIALQSGRPVLIIPDAYDAPGLADHALVAWDGKRAAARALGDAMAGLESKARVTVLFAGGDSVPGADQLIKNLSRHDFETDLVTKSAKGRTSDVILETANDLGVGLIVMGAFEHSKFSHDVFGGVTTEVIQRSKVPVFMAH